TEKGKVGVGKDIRVIGGEVTAWKERKGHALTPAMITGVYDAGLEVLVIGLGVQGALACPEDVTRSIRDQGIACVELRRTPEACRLYNTLLRAGKRVALLAHGTC
ncbi:MAG: MTH938/NDUFAF3 family protein, partial [Candidatus Methylomirabilales bacterium]